MPQQNALVPQQNALVWEGGTVVAVRPVAMRTDIEAAIELITAGKVDARRLISKIFSLDDAVSAIESLRRGEGMKVLISPGRLQVR
jgi:threonine dehydrogenase-like Zn-dependent dehydrogenase